MQVYVFAWQKSYLTSLGEFDGNLEFYSEIDWLVFFICTVFNVILLFNLLISIIMETFARINETRAETTYKEKVNQMCIMQSTIFGIFKIEKSLCEMMFIAQVIKDA